MYETVKIVNGYEIKRMKGTHGFYHVIVNSREFYFKTIKSAVAFCENLN